MSFFNRYLQRLSASLAATLLIGATAHAADASEASAFSLLPLVSMVEAPTALFGASAAFTVVAAQVSGEGTTWTLERASDGARGTLKTARHSLGPVGGKLMVVAISTGWVLYTAGKAVAWTPNELGASLLHNERVSE